MTASETPTTTITSHETGIAETVCGKNGSDVGNGSTLSNGAGSSSSLTSSCSNSSSCSMNSTATKIKKRVSFSLQQTAYFSPEQILSKEERKNECWYSDVELNVSRDEARMAIQALHHQLQMDAAAATASVSNTSVTAASTTTTISKEYGSWVLRCPQDETRIVCLRGIEKYADAAAKYAGQKRLVNSVLQQQSLNNEDVHISLVSRTLSEPFKEVARYYAMKSAEELDLSRKLEEEQEEKERRQREEVATVLLLIMGQENNRKQKEQQRNLSKTPPPPTCSSKLLETSPIVTPRESFSGLGKRSSFTNSPLLQTRNVKPCIESIADRMRGL